LLKDDEYQDLARNALTALEGALRTGTIENCGGRYLARLEITGIDLPPGGSSPSATSVGEPTDEGLAAAAEPTGLQDGEWKTWTDKMQAVIRKGEFEEERALFQDGALRLRESSTFAVRLATWSWVYRELEDALDTATAIRPKGEQGEIPLSKSLTPGDDWRALQVSDLWRSYLTAADSEGGREARSGLESFYAAEKELLAEWEALRRREAERPLRRALFYGEFALQLLPTLVSEAERSEAHPLLRRLYECASADCARLTKRTADRVESIRRNLSVPHPAI
jgi:hypothetical protein